jgi:hypothetical protein
MSGSDRTHHFNSSGHIGRGGISESRLAELKKLPPVYDWELLDNRGRHIAYLSNKTAAEAEYMSDYYVSKGKPVAEMVRLPVYKAGSREAKLLNKAMSLEFYGKQADQKKAARLRSQLKKLTADWLGD